MSVDSLSSVGGGVTTGTEPGPGGEKEETVRVLRFGVDVRLLGRGKVVVETEFPRTGSRGLVRRRRDHVRTTCGRESTSRLVTTGGDSGKKKSQGID